MKLGLLNDLEKKLLEVAVEREILFKETI